MGALEVKLMSCRNIVKETSPGAGSGTGSTPGSGSATPGQSGRDLKVGFGIKHGFLHFSHEHYVNLNLNSEVRAATVISCQNRKVNEQKTHMPFKFVYFWPNYRHSHK